MSIGERIQALEQAVMGHITHNPFEGLAPAICFPRHAVVGAGKKHFPGEPPKVQRSAAKADVGKARRLLGRSPQIALAEGIRRSIAW